MHITELATPALVIDRGRLARNIARMTDALDALDTPLRPHVKTLKCIEPTSMIWHGETGPITVSTLQEAEHFAGRGYTDIVYAVGFAPQKLPRVAALRQGGVDVRILVDSVAQIDAIAGLASAPQPVPILIEIDCDGARSGLAPDDPRLIEVARAIAAAPVTDLAGVLTHAGGSYGCDEPQALREFAERERLAAVSAATTLRDDGHDSAMVSVGSTPTALSAADLSGVTEVRAGVFMTFDLMQLGIGVCRADDMAMSVIATVIGHRPHLERVIIDAGWTALSSDRGTSGQKHDRGYGVVAELDGTWRDGVTVSGTTQEHGVIDLAGAELGTADFPIGSKVRVLPNHACATAAMHDRYWVAEDTGIVDTWTPVRGW